MRLALGPPTISCERGLWPKAYERGPRPDAWPSARYGEQCGGPCAPQRAQAWPLARSLRGKSARASGWHMLFPGRCRETSLATQRGPKLGTRQMPRDELSIAFGPN